MLTLKYRDNRGSESVHPSVISTSWHEGALTAQFADGRSITYGPMDACSQNESPANVPVAFVMNEQGATVAKYEFYARATGIAKLTDDEQQVVNAFNRVNSASESGTI